ncbi:MAG: multifunctional oxoglutarate decarboxylase/oxoglutarate dehydrogenase thiamine pyrophosphate-binding subunit/dihydrolipoyllysine-residue succinyltransferase subunit [Actinomycetes bacterium]
MSAFGPNEWLVDEIYQQFLKDPDSVDKAWWDFFADYQPADGGSAQASATQAGGTAAPPRQEPGTDGGAPPPRTDAPAQPKSPPSPAPAPPRAEPTSTSQIDSRAAGQTADRVDGRSDVQTGDVQTGDVAAGRRDAPPPTKNRTGPAPRPLPAQADEARDDAAAQDLTAVERSPLKGVASRVAANMAASLEIPTATSVRAVPAKLLIDNRTVINNHLRRSRGGKVSFTHLIGFAVVRALESMPEMNHSYDEEDGKPVLVRPQHVNLGLAIDLQKPDGTRQLLVPSIKGAERMHFGQFWTAYEDLIRRARSGKLGVDDFVGTTISLTNPGTIGTVHSVPRLMKGQGTIIGVGAMEYPAEYQGASPETLARLAVSKLMTLTSTYDHRIIQGAQSGDFLRRVHALLLGEDGFYDEIFQHLRVPYEPIRWAQDVPASHEDEVSKQARVHELIHAYRVRGHLMADTDPLEYRQRSHPDLDISSHGLTLWDLDRSFATGSFGNGQIMKLRDILGVLRDSYCRTVGIEYMHIQDPEQRRWIQQRVECGHEKPDRDEQLRILRKLNAAEAFETFLQVKYVGQKRFSLEGSESVIPLMDAVIGSAATDHLDEVCIAMPHRGRLNVLTNIVGKNYSQIFREFEGNQDPRSVQGSGDVKYHLGSTGTYIGDDGNEIDVYCAANPSHLEAVNPVLEGIVRAKQDIMNKGGGDEGFTVLPLLLHGDAAFAGQGVVAETLNLSELRGYRTGGTLHVVVNNQVGFTTSPAESRSSIYATDVARMIQAPIFHVNGDDPEACVRVARLAFEFRQTFKKDVVIDLVCYRRRGHNEGDDPSMTQPLMYDLIDQKRSVRKLYTEALVGRGDITVEEAEQALKDYSDQLEKVFVETRETGSVPHGDENLAEQPKVAVDTSVPIEIVKRVGNAHTSIPDDFAVHPKLKALLERRAEMASQGGVDWAFGELLAFGSLLVEGVPVRLAGQDSRRGTFVQRHAVLTDRNTAAEWTPLAHLDDHQGRFYTYDSLLSEFAAMGFEYGYSVARPEALVLWEAQFGDFGNGAQTIVDEFISSGEQKWNQRSSVVLMLPHGYEGQGPDHSSARIERFLQMCAQDNMTVAVPTTPANYCHLLRWQVHSPFRRPLIVFTPKSMLRHKAARSEVEDFTTGGFRPVLPDTTVDPSSVRRVLLCSGKVYYDLVAAREAREAWDTAIVRVERLYPLPVDDLQGVLAQYDGVEDLRWVQEEPANMGPWPFVALNLPEHLGGRRLVRVSRRLSSSPAVGSGSLHEAEQKALVEQAFS